MCASVEFAVIALLVAVAGILPYAGTLCDSS